MRRRPLCLSPTSLGYCFSRESILSYSAREVLHSLRACTDVCARRRVSTCATHSNPSEHSITSANLVRNVEAGIGGSHGRHKLGSVDTCRTHAQPHAAENESHVTRSMNLDDDVLCLERRLVCLFTRQTHAFEGPEPCVHLLLWRLLLILAIFIEHQSCREPGTRGKEGEWPDPCFPTGTRAIVKQGTETGSNWRLGAKITQPPIR